MSAGVGRMRVNLILARARNGVIGRDGAMPWHLPEDLAHFKRMTSGCPVIMGRKTWDSLPVKFRPLPGRQNLVVTRQTHWNAEGAQVVNSLEQALDLVRQLAHAPAEVWVVGGAQLYALALPLASRAIVTELDIEVAGDTHAPQFDAAWSESARERHTSHTGVQYAFVTYTRNSDRPAA